MTKDEAMDRFMKRISAPSQKHHHRFAQPVWIADVADHGERYSNWHLLTSLPGPNTKQPGVICRANTRTMNWTTHDRPLGYVCRFCLEAAVRLYGKRLDKETLRMIKRTKEEKYGRQTVRKRSARKTT